MADTLYEEVLPEFKRLGGNLVGISVDGGWCQPDSREGGTT